MWKLSYKGGNRGFTLIELLVTIGIIGVLGGIGVVTVGEIKGTKNQATCISNLRGISQGLQSYYNDLRVFPDDGYPYDANDTLPLSTELAGYITTESTFICPTDNDPTSISDFASYDPYYVARKGSYGENELAIGCPRHRGAKSSTSAFSTGATEITKIGAVQVNGQEILPDGTTAQRTISSNGDTMTFDDLSTVTITDASGGSYGCFLVQSVRLSDGTLYSIVRVQNNGTIDVEVTSGSKFEIVTPSAIVGVRGTQFTVTTTNLGFTTEVSLSEGTVVLQNRDTGGTTTLTGVDTGTVNVPTHTHFHYHVDGTYHDHSHQSMNNAHHGNPAVARKAAAASTDANVDDDGDGFSENHGDCDDTNAAVYPGAADTPDNGIDEDCDGQDATVSSDVDADGYTVAQGDCDDNDANVNPGEVEIVDNGIDDDCNPATADSSADQVLVDAINEQPPLETWELFDMLNAAYPVSDNVLIAMMNRNPLMDDWGNADILRSYKIGLNPLSENVLDKMIKTQALMSSSNYADILISNSPLPLSILTKVNLGIPPLDPLDLIAVLAAQL